MPRKVPNVLTFCVYKKQHAHEIPYSSVVPLVVGSLVQDSVTLSSWLGNNRQWITVPDVQQSGGCPLQKERDDDWFAIIGGAEPDDDWFASSAGTTEFLGPGGKGGSNPTRGWGLCTRNGWYGVDEVEYTLILCWSHRDFHGLFGLAQVIGAKAYGVAMVTEYAVARTTANRADEDIIGSPWILIILSPYISWSTSISSQKKNMNKKHLVGGLVAMFYIFPYIGFLIIPIDELIFFRGVAQPPTR